MTSTPTAATVHEGVAAAVPPQRRKLGSLIIRVSTLLLGLASWHLVEKRCIALGGTLTRRWAN